ncbi:conserved Plasmodium protein, unknown function [Plasmodium knowlesi strain H]|uniref:Magnesium transporter n=3 Tax=Plasmodium knowlesi TaxID=5850 RepID=A0A5K1UDR8_PLAKH|nr:magnesium transporter, putative [Plasmodium knowlesi strain H]OTN68089.1 Uncharacterized protein PKNOH_S04343100 [Plasmodium knowlesi]CAA9990256.1 magnesium transporter, putative [Plasmodium knowlesi strain H]SBO26787.1 conserved Plasmodium protein, unknown function [Plasmodium knowlesi strain H]SBO28423.1 conserved Plasmodium protein, unknown function [Plasmodium knowlesi strain H]VVS79730.1 magnesium transporter, putative [Plasmodium knowlesi strain H]|eukprot:XP_002258045.1 hypothetical protein, conserved in Plasmodium species [Plasmodium knowlesi strain H]
MDTTLIGIAICFVGSFLGALGDKFVHDSYIKDNTQKKHMSQMTMWLFGTLLSVVIDPILTICSLYFASAVLVAPFAGVHILWNLIITNISLKIKTKLHQYMGSFFLICGIALIIIFSEKKVDIHSMNDLASLYSQTKVIIYLVLTFTIIVTLLVICLLPFLFKDIKNVFSKNEQLLYMNKFSTNTYTHSCEISLFKKNDTRAKFSGGTTSFKTGKVGYYKQDPTEYPLNASDDPRIGVTTSDKENACGNSPTRKERFMNRSTEGDNFAPPFNDGIITSSQGKKLIARRRTKVQEKTNNANRIDALNNRQAHSLPRLPAKHTFPKHPTEKIKKINFKSSKTEKKKHLLKFRKNNHSWNEGKENVERCLRGKSLPVNAANSDMLDTKCSKQIESCDDLYWSETIPHPSDKKENNLNYKSGSHTTRCSNLEPLIEPTPSNRAESTSTYKKKKKKKKKNLLLSPNRHNKMIKKKYQNKGREEKQEGSLRYTNSHKQNGHTVEDHPEMSPQSSHPSSVPGSETFSPINILKRANKFDSSENWKDGEPFSLMVYSPTRERGNTRKASIGSSPASNEEITNPPESTDPNGSSNICGRSDSAQLHYMSLIASMYPSADKSRKIRHPEILYRICCCTVCGMTGGFVNIFSEQIIGILSKEKFHMFTHPFAYVLIMLTLFCLCNQLLFLNISLSKFSVTSVIPLIMSNIVFFSSLTTIIMRQEESVIQFSNAAFFSLGVLLVIIGILYLQYNINRILLRCFKPKKG